MVKNRLRTQTFSGASQRTKDEAQESEVSPVHDRIFFPGEIESDQKVESSAGV